MTSVRSENILKALLGHQIARTTVCRLCGHESRVLSPHEYRLGVALKNGRRIEDLLRNNTFAPASVLGYRCDKCKQESKAVQNSRLTAFPDILELDFLRFEQVRRGSYKKNCRAVPFGLDLDLSAFSESDAPLKYRLISVVQHLGSFDTGHYRCVARTPSGTWEELDDNSVRKVRASTATDPAGSWTPYTLFYAQIDPSERAERRTDIFPNGSAEAVALQPLKSPSFLRTEKSQDLTNGMFKQHDWHSVHEESKDRQ